MNSEGRRATGDNKKARGQQTALLGRGAVNKFSDEGRLASGHPRIAQPHTSNSSLPRRCPAWRWAVTFVWISALRAALGFGSRADPRESFEARKRLAEPSEDECNKRILLQASMYIFPHRKNERNTTTKKWMQCILDQCTSLHFF